VNLIAHEVRFDSADDGTIEGYAVRFDTVDAYRTTFDRNAFAGANDRIPLLWNHDPAQVVGSVRSIAPQDTGLKIVGKLNLDVQRAREVRSMLLAGDVSGLSIGFRTLKDERRTGGIRHITKVDLKEISFTAFPAVPNSHVTSVRVAADSAAFYRAIDSAINSLKGL
jgi:uncharacterized protein